MRLLRVALTLTARPARSLSTLSSCNQRLLRTSQESTARVVASRAFLSEDNQERRNGGDRRANYLRNLGLFAGLIGATVVVTDWTIIRNRIKAKTNLSNEDPVENLLASYGREIKGQRVYTLSEVSGHDSKEKRIWMTFGSGVYDVTDFVDEHPGGDKIMMAAGGSLEPFWELYALHKRKDVLDTLESYRIGNLSPDDRITEKNPNDPFANEPKRHPALVARSLKPFNAEPPAEILVESFVTPNALFYVRHHLPVPDVDAKDYRLELEGIGIKSSSFTLAELKKLPKYKMMVTLQCAGNRRSEMNKIREVKGLAWDKAAISNAEWTGVRLVDLLNYLKVDLNDSRIKHVQFEGLDLDPGSAPYGASIPAEKALDAKSDILIAYEMNGEPLSRDHGFPVRAVAPGVVAARSVKWLSKIVLSDKESDSHWQQRDYKGFSPNIDQSNVDFSTAPAIIDVPVQSAICDPLNGQLVKLNQDGQAKVRGYAYSGGGRKIVRVDVSADGGKSWTNAQLQQEDKGLYRTWAWTLWEVNLPLKEQLGKGGPVELVCKATDSSYSVQPESFEGIWNFRGVLSNAWHRVRITLSG